MNINEMNWKKKTSVLLKSEKIIDDKFTGSIVLNINQGAVCNAEKKQIIK